MHHSEDDPQQRELRRGQRGFTLIELMIVVAIIAILAGILIPNFVNARAQAQTAACESNLRSIATALELYYADNQVYPSAAGAPVQPSLLTANGVAYLNNTPRDPAAQAGSATYSLTTTQATGGNPGRLHDRLSGRARRFDAGEDRADGEHQRQRLRHELHGDEGPVRRRRRTPGRAVIDLLGEALGAAGSGSGVAYPLCFAAGMATSVGPCVAPRYIAVAALANGTRRGWCSILAFVAGVIGAYVTLGICAASISGLWTSSGALYTGLAVALAGSGIVTVAGACGERGSHAHDRTPEPPPGSVISGRFGGPFLLGASSALVVSPCCTPFVAAIAGFTVLSGRAATGAALLAAFACGHAVPLVCAGALGTRLTLLFTRLSCAQAPKVVAGALMLALGCYYGALA